MAQRKYYRLRVFSFGHSVFVPVPCISFVQEILAALLAGYPLIVFPVTSPMELFQIFREEKPTIIMIVLQILNLFYQRINNEFSKKIA
ncbi:hypothetical protein [Candidatus Coxiella mudrowiae]|uniref:hypothetical protein n=1 Tax=Candidatus Coxiella mudrowiae TaxID=2054173 RepID=UPI0012FF08C3|nr:hypothetical protein [Candidatus Coxiella mudrowiae]